MREAPEEKRQTRLTASDGTETMGSTAVLLRVVRHLDQELWKINRWLGYTMELYT